MTTWNLLYPIPVAVSYFASLSLESHIAEAWLHPCCSLSAASHTSLILSTFAPPFPHRPSPTAVPHHRSDVLSACPVILTTMRSPLPRFPTQPIRARRLDRPLSATARYRPSRLTRTGTTTRTLAATSLSSFAMHLVTLA